MKYRDIDRAIKVAGKKVRTLPTKRLNENLEYACGDLADAYRCGVEEAQSEIVQRLRELGKSLTGVSESEL